MNAAQVKNTALGALALAGGALARALGGWDMALKVVVGFMAADYLTGFLVAALWHRSGKSPTGALDSKAGFRGIVKKCMILLLIWMAAMLDRVTGSDFIRTTVSLFFIANEGLSILENTAVMGVPYPAFVKHMLDAMRQQGDGGESQPGG